MKLTDKVPGTKFTAEQICRCHVVPEGTEIRKGQVLAYVGAYNNKYVVESITFLGTGPGEWGTGTYDIYAVAVRYLGQFFADNRVKPASKRRGVIKEIRVYQTVGNPHITQIKSLRPVVPVGDVKPVSPKKLVYSSEMEQLTPEQLNKIVQVYGAPPVAAPAPKPLPPEAVLASFRVN